MMILAANAPASALPLAESRARALELSRSPKPLRRLECAAPYPVRISQAIQDLAQAVDARQSSQAERERRAGKTEGVQTSVG